MASEMVERLANWSAQLYCWAFSHRIEVLWMWYIYENEPARWPLDRPPAIPKPWVPGWIKNRLDRDGRLRTQAGEE